MNHHIYNGVEMLAAVVLSLLIGGVFGLAVRVGRLGPPRD
jgi:hypothetical protein